MHINVSRSFWRSVRGGDGVGINNRKLFALIFFYFFFIPWVKKQEGRGEVRIKFLRYKNNAEACARIRNVGVSLWLCALGGCGAKWGGWGGVGGGGGKRGGPLVLITNTKPQRWGVQFSYVYILPITVNDNNHMWDASRENTKKESVGRKKGGGSFSSFRFYIFYIFSCN